MGADPAVEAARQRADALGRPQPDLLGGDEGGAGIEHVLRGRRVVPAPDPHRGGRRALEGEAGVAAPRQRAGEDGAARFLGHSVGTEQEEGAGAQVRLHAAARLDDLGPRRQRLGGRRPLGGPVAPAEVGQVRRGRGEERRGGGDLVQRHRPRLAVGDARPLAQDTVVVGVERQRDLERAVGVDEVQVGLRARHADVLHAQAGRRGAVTVRDAQRGGPGRLVVVGGVGQGVQRSRDAGRQPLHVGVDVGPEPGLVQAAAVVDQEAVARALGRHDDPVHPITIAEP